MSIKYVHTNLIARDWKRLAEFYEQVFGCKPLSARDLSGRWLDGVTGLDDAHITGMHMSLPGFGEGGPTLELFQYDAMPDHPDVRPNTPGFSHIAFLVDDVAAVAEAVIANGGRAVGELTSQEVPGVGVLTVQYLYDPEGNIVEVQNWDA
ncbi:VOC family protein [Pseudodesulfovibrio cashew]|uniref:VOC family protein n=1 Tax=Pseudodesulfovibrio cashew TaxID=2678688 RepID=A0A6I6JHR8_9BACT|nr:VOC family protein [Pseudodesulfovibrio cashew]QGY39647.1 VOC family protein [Pseudodesulfovibrio cashew]